MTITFIHGTWAAERIRGRDRPHAVPYRVDGGWPLATALLARWPATVPYLLRWSGGNSVRDRRRGAAALVRHVRAVERANPGGTHLLVGHSHGGTVACYALRRAAVRRALAGAVCLSTPFVTFSRRPVRDARLLQLTLFLMALLPLLLLTGGGDDLWVSFSLADAPPAPPVSAPTTWQEVLGAVIGLGLLLGARPAWRSMHRAAERFLKKAALPDLEPTRVPLMLVRSPSDEASGGLAASQFLAWVLLQLGRTMLMPFGGVRVGPREFIAGMLPIVAMSTVIGLAALAAGYALQRDVSLPLVPVLIGMMLAVPVLMLAFSRDTATHALFVHTSVEPCPPGRWELHQLPPDSGTTVETGSLRDPHSFKERLWSVLQWNPFNPFPRQHGERPAALMHSITYQDARAVQLVAAFVEGRIAAQVERPRDVAAAKA